ncbi:MAG TPA: tetratricopeptide repeat protein, partial [Gemmatimonadaceae bacterium]
MAAGVRVPLESQRPVLLSERDREVLRGFAARIDPADAGAHNNLGVLYYHKGMTEEAVAAFTRALTLDPRMAIAERNLRVAYCDTGYFDRTVAALRERLAANPTDHEARRSLAEAYLLAGQPAQAVPECEALITARPDDVAAMQQLAKALHRSGDLEAAMTWLRRALERQPDNPALLFPLAEVAYHRGLNEEAETALRAVLARVPDHADALYLLGFVLGDRGYHDQAQEVTRRAMQLNPSLGRAQTNLSLERPDRATPAVPAEPGEPLLHEGGALVHYNLGLAFRQKGYYTEALREYRLAAERGEDHALVTQAMAEVHLLRHEAAAAVQLYDGLLADQPQSPKLWNERGVALHQSGRVEDALVSYERAIAADPHYALALNNLGVARFHCGRGDLAIDAFTRALQVEPAFVKARLNLALLLFRRKELPLCLEAYRQVLSLEPGHPVAWNGVGLVLTEMRRFDDARNAFGRAIDARPDYAEAHYNLSFALSNLGDFEGALRATRRALELDPYYVPQKFELAIDLEYENPRVTVPPDLNSEQRSDAGINDFTFDVGAIEALFDALAPATAPAVRGLDGAPAYAAARQLLAQGDLDRAIEETRRAMEQGAPQADGLVLLGEAFLRRGAQGEALERFRQARGLDPSSAAALAGEVRALVALGRERDAEAAAEELASRCPDDVDALLLVARVRAGIGDAARALATLAEARRLAPMRADVLKQI